MWLLLLAFRLHILRFISVSLQAKDSHGKKVKNKGVRCELCFKSETWENIYFFIYPLNQGCVPLAPDDLKLPQQPARRGGVILVIWRLISEGCSAGHFCIIPINGISACVLLNPATIPKNILSCMFGINKFLQGISGF